MKFNRKGEASGAAWLWRLMLGPAMLVDGILATLSLGSLQCGLGLEVSRKLAAKRFSSSIAIEHFPR